MALNAYVTAVTNLLQAPSSPVPLIPTGTLTTYINTARNQVAADAECIRAPGSLVLSSGTQGYAFSSISTIGATVGFGAVMSIRSARIGSAPLDLRAWEWFAQYYLGRNASGTPVRAAQQGQGANGTIFFHPIPNAAATVAFDAVLLPVALSSDATPEAIPPLWTDAVPFYAAWLAMQQLQRQNDANQMFARYQELVRRGRQMGTPSELPERLPGGMGTQIAAAHMPLTQPPQTGR